ncbi:MAG: tetratricopeptide repeat protein [Alloprevotella sp.]
MKLFLLALMLQLSACFTFAAAAGKPTDDKAAADKAYRAKNYVQAASLYEACVKQATASGNASADERATLYYNLGNAYYRLKDYAHAVLNYRRALHLNPADADAAFNLQLTEAKLTDRFDAPSEMFFISWAKDFIYSQSAATWGNWSLLFLLLALVGGLVGIMPWTLWLKRTVWTAAWLLLACSLLCEVFAKMQTARLQNTKQAVIMQATPAQSSPTGSAKALRQLHEGTTVEVRETCPGGWLQVAMPDGSEGYVCEAHCEQLGL